MKNALSWFEIPVTDYARAKKFYSALVGAELQEVPMGDEMQYAMFPLEEPMSGIGGAICRMEGMTPSHAGSMVYLNGGDDLSAILSRVEPAGGKILQPKTAISPEFGFFATFEDTEGNRIGLHSMS